MDRVLLGTYKYQTYSPKRQRNHIVYNELPCGTVGWVVAYQLVGFFEFCGPNPEGSLILLSGVPKVEGLKLGREEGKGIETNTVSQSFSDRCELKVLG